MSHHLDSPLARKDPRLDISDVYLFKGDAGTVFVMNVNPMSGKGGFHPEAMYEFKVDTNDDAVEDMTFRVTFGERDQERQTITVRQLRGDAAANRMAEGVVIAEGVTDETIEGKEGIKVFCGSAGEPFYIVGPVITAVKKAIDEGGAVELGDFDTSTAANLFGNTNVSTIVLEIPDGVLGVDEIGFWGTVALATDAGGWRQVQRAATPLMNTLFDVTQMHTRDGEHGDYNATEPAHDRENYGGFVEQKIEAAVRAMQTVDDPKAFAQETVQKLFPDVLHYRVGSDPQFNLQERNGRDLKVNTVDVMFELILHKPVRLGIDERTASGQLRTAFPYLSLPV